MKLGPWDCREQFQAHRREEEGIKTVAMISITDVFKKAI